VNAVLDNDLRAFERDGYVVFESALPRTLVQEMHAVWSEYFAPFSRRQPESKRFLMHVPFKSPLCDPRFLENPRVLAIADRVLGRRYLCGYLGSETPLPGADAQQPHFDLAFWKRFTFLNGPLSLANRVLGSLRFYYGLQVSVPLVDSGLDNAPFEIWPATNRLRRRDGKSVRLTMPAGSILVRDIRNIHRGTEHRGAAPRPFLSLVYLRRWVPGWRAPEIPADVYASLPARTRQLFRRASIGQPVPDPEAWAVRAR
jgi:hypothetical protein